MSRALATAVVLALVLPAGASAWSPIVASRPVWRPPVPYSMHNAGSADLGADMSESIVREAMQDWTSDNLMCTSLTATFRGRIATRPGSYEGTSVIGWVESGWRHDSFAIGVTGPSWSTYIVEADMELNGEDFVWITGSGSGSRVNAYSIVLHEGGHYYGLGHSGDSRATMYASYSGGVSMLNADDTTGICTLYPGSGGPPDCSTTGCPPGQECVSGTCRAITGDGGVCSPCSDMSDCTDGFCLGYPDGGGYCGASCASRADCGASEVCANVSGYGQCVRVDATGRPSCAGTTPPSGCSTDADCGATERCNTSTRACEPRPMTGAPLGDPCATGGDCTSGTCFRGACSQTCDWLDPTSCPGGFYCSATATGACGGGGVCIAGVAGTVAMGGSCGADTECATLFCAGGRCATPCSPGAAASCPAGYACQAIGGAGCGGCTMSGATGDSCEINDDCASGMCATMGERTFCTELCDATDPCPERFDCTPAGGVSVCVPNGAGLGEACESNADCISGICVTEGSRRYCTRVCTDLTPCPGDRFSCDPTSDPATRVCSPLPGTDVGGGRDSGGCGCEVPASTTGGAPGAVALVALGLLLVSRRRRRPVE